MTAPASRNAWTLAASRSERQPLYSSEPICVGMSAVSMMSLMPTGMPSIGESGLPSRQRCVDCAAASRAAATFSVTKAPTSRLKPLDGREAALQIGARRVAAGAERRNAE